MKDLIIAIKVVLDNIKTTIYPENIGFFRDAESFLAQFMAEVKSLTDDSFTICMDNLYVSFVAFSILAEKQVKMIEKNVDNEDEMIGSIDEVDEFVDELWTLLCIHQSYEKNWERWFEAVNEEDGLPIRVLFYDKLFECVKTFSAPL